MLKTTSPNAMTNELIEDVCARLADGNRVRRTLPENGRLHIDRLLPFLCVYRQPADRADELTEKTIVGQAAYVMAPGAARYHRSLSNLVRRVADTMSQQFGAVLSLEVWAGAEDTRSADPADPDVSPQFRVFAPKSSQLDRTIDALLPALRSIKVMKQQVRVTLERGGRPVPPDMKPLITREQQTSLKCLTIGLEIPPVYRSNERDQEFPLLLRTFRRRIDIALRKAFFAFARSQTTHRPPHYHELGRRAVVKAVWQVDQQLWEVGSQFDYLLNVTPINTSATWSEFKRVKYERAPEFHYGPLPFDPTLLKRQLFGIPLERIEDPALYNLFLEKQVELDRKISMLRDRNTPLFRYGSLELFGGVSNSLFATAKDILLQTTGRSRDAGAKSLSAEAFAAEARAEIERYTAVAPEFTPAVCVTDEVAGMIVSDGKLLISPDMSFPRERVNALIQHEVGTHLVTWFNGRSQPFRQLQTGLAGYEELQEGLAVLSEYLVGGLTPFRLRQLAGRVVAVRAMLDEADFVDCFRLLTDTYGFGFRIAYTITMRVFRGGGLTKDAVYLRGLLTMLNYVRVSGDLQPLFIGKIAASHIHLMRELQFRQVLLEPPLTPHYMQHPQTSARLERLRSDDVQVTDLLSDCTRQLQVT